MKIKKSLLISYVFVMVTPILTCVCLYTNIYKLNQDRGIVDYINSLEKINYYEKKIVDSNLYHRVNRDLKILKDEDTNKIQIDLYDKYGIVLYSTSPTNVIYELSKEQLFSDLYKFQEGYRANSIKKPVIKDGELIGFYKITVAKEDLVKKTNNLTVISIIIFIIIMFLILIVVVLFLNRKFTKPIGCLILNMNEYAKGNEDIDIKYNKDDEIGQLIKHFLLMKEEIREKRNEIEKEQKSKEYLVAAISHDLKTPLTSIRAYGEIINQYENLNGDEIKKYSSIILNKSDYMKNMLEDLFTYTVLSSEYKLQKVLVECEEVFEMLFDGYDEMCKLNNLKYSYDINVDGKCLLDVNAMIRVMDNLVNNALRYTKSNGNIYMGAYSKSLNMPKWLPEDIKEELNTFQDDNILIFVKNDGNPIPKQEQELVLKAFYQSDGSRNKGNNTGVGLGLSIVKLIVNKHGGQVKIISRENFGTLIGFCIKKEN